MLMFGKCVPNLIPIFKNVYLALCQCFETIAQINENIQNFENWDWFWYQNCKNYSSYQNCENQHSWWHIPSSHIIYSAPTLGFKTASWIYSIETILNCNSKTPKHCWRRPVLLCHAVQFHASLLSIKWTGQRSLLQVWSLSCIKHICSMLWQKTKCSFYHHIVRVFFLFYSHLNDIYAWVSKDKRKIGNNS